MDRGGFRRRGKGGRGGRHAKRARGEGALPLAPDGRGHVEGKRAEWRYENLREYRNEKFETFYRAQGIVPEGEWELFVSVMQQQLPVTFRINPLAPDAATALHQITHSEWSQPMTLDDGRVVQPPRPLSFIPGAWQLGYGKPDLRKNASLKRFHEWIQVLTADGTVSRQEAVSMIPPLLLDVQPEHYVLDMCAAPGSKTAQLLEALHMGELRAPSATHSATPALPFQLGGTPATGLVVANDTDSKRAYLLTHQCSRIGSPNLVVTCHDAQLFPNLNKRPGASAPASAPAAAEGAGRRAQKTEGFFDRVLCDVPCSGDGTGRKSADAILRWLPSNGLALHPLQIQITMRGLALTKVGGYVCYSTCSLNPAEDEAVVAEVLRRCEGSVELVDVSQRLPGLKRLPGLCTWKVFDKDMVAHESYEASQAANEHGHVSAAAKKLLPSHFPPSPAESAAQGPAALHLERCMRVTPHLQDTGGFFICLLHKKAPLPSSAPWYGHAGKAGAAAVVPPAPAGAAGTGAGTAVGSESGVGQEYDSEEEVERVNNKGRLGFYATATAPASAAASAAPSALAAGEGGTTGEDAAEEEEAGVALAAAAAAEGEGEDEAMSGSESEGEEGAEEEEGEGDSAPAPAAAVPAPTPTPTAHNAAAGPGGNKRARPGPGAAGGRVSQVADGRSTWKASKKPNLPPASSGAGAGAAGSSSSSGVEGETPYGRDGKGRVLAGRHEMTVYCRVEDSVTQEVSAAYGLSPAFPASLLHTRSESGSGGILVLLSSAVASAVVPQQKLPNGSGRVKVVNSGIKIWAENRDKMKPSASKPGASAPAPAPAPAPEASAGTAGTAGGGLAANISDYRLLQEGLLLLLPYLTKRAVHASGREIATVLRFRGNFAPSAVYPRRLARVLDAVPPGSFALVLNPALDGHEDEDGSVVAEGGMEPGAGLRLFAAANDTSPGDGVSTVPRPLVPLSAAAGIAPPLRTHYVLEQGQGQEAPVLRFAPPSPASPAMRIWPGSSPLCRVALCMWKGKHRFNVMLSKEEATSLVTTVTACGYMAPEASSLSAEAQQALAAAPVKGAGVAPAAPAAAVPAAAGAVA